MSKVLYKEWNPVQLKNKSYLAYIPHGIDTDIFYPVTHNSPKEIKYAELESSKSGGAAIKEYDAMKRFKDEILNGESFDFIVLYNNRNIKRKSPGDVVLAFRAFWDRLPDEKKNKVCLLFHTQPVDDQGTDLPAVANALADKCKIKFTNKTLSQVGLNFLYNIADVTVNLASNEGFGLSMAESLAAGTMAISNVTGGLQDQMAFRDENGELITIEKHLNADWGSNHDKRYTSHGEWVLPVWPTNRHLAGSPITPYIFDDRCSWEDVAERLYEAYLMTRKERKRRGKLGRDFIMSEDSRMNSKRLGLSLMSTVDMILNEWTPREKYELVNVTERIKKGNIQ